MSLPVTLNSTLISNIIFQIPIQSRRNSLIYSYANMWAVPCDGIDECQIGPDGYAEDESPSKCGQPTEETFVLLVSGFVAVATCMLIYLTYITRG